MEEVLPGVWHWTAEHPNTGGMVGCHWVRPARSVIDALVPEEGLEAFDEEPPERFLLSNRHHLRHAELFAERFGCVIECSEPGLHEFEDGPQVRATSLTCASVCNCAVAQPVSTSATDSDRSCVGLTWHPGTLTRH